MVKNTYTINSATSSKVVVTITLATGQSYVETLNNVPTDDITALDPVLKQYHKDYQKGLSSAKTVDPSVTAIIGEPQEVI
jgi:hypothetical protein